MRQHADPMRPAIRYQQKHPEANVVLRGVVNATNRVAVMVTAIAGHWRKLTKSMRSYPANNAIGVLRKGTRNAHIKVIPPQSGSARTCLRQPTRH